MSWPSPYVGRQSSFLLRGPPGQTRKKAIPERRGIPGKAGKDGSPGKPGRDGSAGKSGNEDGG